MVMESLLAGQFPSSMGQVIVFCGLQVMSRRSKSAAHEQAKKAGLCPYDRRSYFVVCRARPEASCRFFNGARLRSGRFSETTRLAAADFRHPIRITFFIPPV